MTVITNDYKLTMETVVHLCSKEKLLWELISST